MISISSNHAPLSGHRQHGAVSAAETTGLGKAGQRGETRNPYELQRRADKAFRLATHLHKHHITADECINIQPGEWVSLARTLRMNPPSDLTQAEAVRMLREMEAVAA